MQDFRRKGLLSLKAYSKINLTLEVLGKRDDGYHEIVSVLQTIDLADTLFFEENEELQLESNIPELNSPDNLVLQAAKLLQETTGFSGGALIQLDKKVPFPAGLGSGSSDAATTLKGLNLFWKLNLSQGKLTEIAKKIGSDVAFFLYGGTALAQGRGEKITPLPPIPKTWLVLLEPSLNSVPRNKTARLYGKLNSSHFTKGEFTQKLIAQLQEGRPLQFFNVFESVAFDFFKGLKECLSRMLSSGAKEVHLAGSGPILFTVAHDEFYGKILLNRLIDKGFNTYLVCTHNSNSKERYCVN